jgi:peptide/nickel transport system permease protein
MGFTLCTGALFILVNLLVDMLQAAIDPRGAA